MSHEPPWGGSRLFKGKPLLIIALIVSLGGALYWALAKLFQLAASSFGYDLAILIVSGVTVGIMLLILLGMGVASVLQWVICDRILTNKKKPSGLANLLFNIFGFKPVSLTPLTPLATDSTPDNDLSAVALDDIEQLLIATEQRKRGGKKSPYPEDVQIRAVRDWTSLQTRGASVTLQQFLEERFGTAPETSMPLVPNQTFYSWRKKVLQELRDEKRHCPKADLRIREKVSRMDLVE